MVLNMCPISGGNWNNSSNAGVWTLNWNNSRGNSNDNVGFRSDSATPRTAQADSGAKGSPFLRVGQPSAKSAARLFTGRRFARMAFDGLEAAS
jgi:hypothetical protein